MEFSIIVPIYKVEKYLRNCIDSILVQTYKNYEIILVDDGSPDGCGAICDEYEKKHTQVRVIHKVNGGLSSARNAGLDIAVGKYVIFLDSDDFWDDSDALKHFHDNLSDTQADVLIFPAKRYYEENNQYTYILNGEADREKIIDTNVNNAVRYMLEHNIFRAAAWNKVIRRSLIEEHRMRFLEGYLSEDMDWCGDLLIHSSRFDFYGVPVYVYRQQRAGSITAGKTEKLVSDKLFMCDKGFKQAMQLEDKEKQELLSAYYAYEYSVLLGVSAGVRNRKLLKEMKDLQELLDYDICNKVKKVRKLKKILGYTLTRKALCIFVKVKK